MTGSEPYSADNLLDRFSRDSTLAVHYRQMMDRERALMARRAAARGVSWSRLAPAGIPGDTCSPARSGIWSRSTPIPRRSLG